MLVQNELLDSVLLKQFFEKGKCLLAISTKEKLVVGNKYYIEKNNMCFEVLEKFKHFIKIRTILENGATGDTFILEKSDRPNYEIIDFPKDFVIEEDIDRIVAGEVSVQFGVLKTLTAMNMLPEDIKTFVVFRSYNTDNLLPNDKVFYFINKRNKDYYLTRDISKSPKREDVSQEKTVNIEANNTAE